MLTTNSMVPNNKCWCKLFFALLILPLLLTVSGCERVSGQYGKKQVTGFLCGHNLLAPQEAGKCVVTGHPRGWCWAVAFSASEKKTLRKYASDSDSSVCGTVYMHSSRLERLDVLDSNLNMLDGNAVNFEHISGDCVISVVAYSKTDTKDNVKLLQIERRNDRFDLNGWGMNLQDLPGNLPWHFCGNCIVKCEKSLQRENPCFMLTICCPSENSVLLCGFLPFARSEGN